MDEQTFWGLPFGHSRPPRFRDDDVRPIYRVRGWHRPNEDRCNSTIARRRAAEAPCGFYRDPGRFVLVRNTTTGDVNWYDRGPKCVDRFPYAAWSPDRERDMGWGWR